MAAVATKRRSSRQMASRKRSRYVDPETDDEIMTPSEDDLEFEIPRELNAPPRASKRRRTVEPHQERETRSKTNNRVKTKATRLGRRSVKTKIIVVGRPKRARSDVVKQEPEPGKFIGASDGVIPPWKTLPADILRDIFFFGSQPLTSSNVTWLLNAARTCRDFMEPALEALHYWPSIWSPLHLHRLLELLQRREGRLINYNTKVKRLDVDVRRLAYAAHNRPLFDLGDLLAQLPRLQHLEIVHPMDEPPYRDTRIQSWTYQSSLYRGLHDSQIRLSAWRWTRDMFKSRSASGVYTYMSTLHGTSAFENIRELVLCGFSAESEEEPLSADDAGSVKTHDIWTAISRLKHVKDISFISCSAARERALEKLPVFLERLELSNCHEVNSDVLAHYLIAGGSQLKELVLNHNPALDLAFLPGLKSHCPRLQELQMSLHFYSELHVTNDAEPLYDELLQADEIPAWPTTMRVIDLQHLQKWASAGAINLFQSLVDSASDLPDLRYIVLHSHIDIPWRDRTSFREQWIEKLEKVFKRPNRPPKPYHGSKREFRLWKEKQQKASDKVQRDPPTDPVLRPAAELASGLAQCAPEPLRRRSERVAKVLISPSTTSAAAEVESSEEDNSTDSEDNLFIQGRCDVVDIRIDNQRPRENQFTEQDFLDTEASGDEDWNEDADDAVEEGYAW